MNWLSPICSFLQAAFLQLSRVDGREGLTLEDFKGVITIVRNVQDRWGDSKSGGEKAALVAAAVGIQHADSVSGWVVHTLVWLAHAYASRKGMLK